MLVLSQSGGGGLGVLPQKYFGLNGVKSCIFRQNRHGNTLSWKPRIVCMTFWEKGLWNLEVIRFIKHLFYVQYWRAKRARKNYNNKIKTKFWTPSPTPQTSTQDPTSDKSQGGGGPDPRSPPPSGSAHAFNCTRDTLIEKISVPAIKTKIENSRYINNVHIILCWNDFNLYHF